MLKGIPGVAEAMIVGEGKPFCSALLWLTEGAAEKKRYDAIDESIKELSRRLSHPEQLKCWALLPNDLSLVSGDLTPSLKLKRESISRRFGRVIAACYDDDISQSDGISHLSRA